MKIHIAIKFSDMEKSIELVRLGNRIRDLRTSKGLSQAKLGMKILKDQQSIHKVEMGDFNPTYLYLLEICEGLEIKRSELLDF